MRNLAQLVFRFALVLIACAQFETAARADTDDDWRDANAAVERGDFEQAIRLYTKAIDARYYKGADLAKLYWMRGKAKFRHHGFRLQDDKPLFRSVVEDLNVSIDLDATNAGAYTDRGAAHMRLGQYENAITDFTAAIARRDDYFLAYNNRCLAYEKLGRRAEAITDCRKAQELDPKHWQPRETLQRLEVTPTTANNPSTNIKRKPVEQHYENGRVLYHRGQYREALKELDRTITFDANYEFAHALRGATLLALGKPEAAISALDKGIALGRTNGIQRSWFAWPYLHKGLALMKLKRADEAIAVFGLAIESDPRSAATYYFRGEAYLEKLASKLEERRENAKLAASDLEQAVKLDPKESRFWVQKAIAHFALGDEMRACEAVKRACEHGDCSLAREFTECR